MKRISILHRRVSLMKQLALSCSILEYLILFKSISYYLGVLCHMISEENIVISHQDLVKISEIDQFKGEWELLSQERKYHIDALKRVTTIESIGSSNRIEGNILSDKDVERVLLHINAQSFASRDEEEVAGYAELMQLIFDEYQVIPFTENYIKYLHKVMLKHVEKDGYHCGEYKRFPNSVAAFDADGKEIGIVFQAASVFETPSLMEELVVWVRKTLEEHAMHPLVTIAVFIVHFLAIHPFQDGNGRLSRALTTLLFLQCGYRYVMYSSLESIIEASKARYYQALRKTQQNIWSPDVEYESWFSYFFSALLKQKLHLQEKLSSMPLLDRQLGQLARSILRLFDQQEQWTIVTMAEQLQVSSSAVSKSVKSLVDGGYLVKYGVTRGAWYERPLH